MHSAKFLYFFIIELILCICTLNVFAQDLAEKTLTLSLNEKNKAEAIRKIAKVSEVPILFSDDFFEDNNKQVKKDYQNESIQYILEDLLKDESIKITVKKKPFLIILSRADFVLYGYVKDRQSKEALPYANILINKNRAIYADQNGKFFLKVKAGEQELKCSFVTYNDTTIALQIEKDTQQDLFLNANNRLPEIIVQDENSIETISDFNKYNYKELIDYSKKIPSTTGSNDLFQTAKLIPGVQSGAAGIGGHFVRGSSHGQNQYLLDDVVIYNPFHALGLISSITPEVTKSFRVHKVGYDAAYGDFTSSLFDIKLREGNAKKLEGGLNANLNDASLNLGFPIMSNKSAIFVYGRKSYGKINTGNILESVLFPDSYINLTKNYYDIIAKAYAQINKKNKISLTYYKGYDNINGTGELEEEDQEDENELEEEIENVLSWGNTIGIIKWQSILKPNLFLNASASTNWYSSSTGTLIEQEREDEIEDFFASVVESKNKDYEAKIQLDYLYKKWWRIKLGSGHLVQIYKPLELVTNEEAKEFQDEDEDFEPDLDDLREMVEVIKEQSRKTHLYIENHFDFANCNIKLGLRNTLYGYENYTKFNSQPRVSIDYRLIAKHFLSFNYTSSVQHNHLISNSAISLPQDFWQPSQESINPQIGNHFDLGYTMYISRNNSLRSNLYYKQIKNIAKRDSIINSTHENDNYIIGKSKSYGFELEYNLAKPKYGLKLSYALSKSSRQFDAENFGQEYPFQFDRRHELKSLFFYSFNKNLTIGSIVYMSTGHPKLYAFKFNLQEGIRTYNNDPIGSKNQTKTDPQYRFDLSLTYQRKIKFINHSIKLNIFNTFDVPLPLYYSINEDLVESPKFNLGFLPSLSYSANF